MTIEQILSDMTIEQLENTWKALGHISWSAEDEYQKGVSMDDWASLVKSYLDRKRSLV